MDDFVDVYPSPRRDKQCDICSRSFARSEHLARHRRTHTKEKPFPCPYCRKSFQRSDVKAAHVKKCHGNSPGYGDQDEDRNRKRVRIACHGCRKRKMRCDGNQPCAPCNSTQAACHYPASSTSTRHAQTQLENELHLATSNDDSHLPDAEDEPFLDTRADSLQESQQEAFNLPIQGGPSIPFDTSTMVNADGLALSNDDIMYSIPASTGGLDFWQMPPTFWFDGSDLSWSDQIFDSTSPISNHVFSSSMQNLTATMQEYFDRKSRAPSPSLNKASKMWYSAPPNMDNYNKDIVRIFLNIFRRYIPETFPLFKDFAVGRHNRAAYTLAIAATGGLFCTVPGSAEVAKAMYNDSRRLLLASFHVRSPVDEISTSPQDKLVTVKTFILLKIYGLCSGDKRCYEFVEAFHGNLVHAVQEYSHACEISGFSCVNDEINTRLLETLQILDCYRVIIMQRPPSLSWHHVDLFTRSLYPRTQMFYFCEISRDLTDGGHKIGTSCPQEFHLPSLAGLCSHLWPATHSRQNRGFGNGSSTKSTSFWGPHFAELACDNWLRTIGQTSNYSSLAIYHMMNIMLHADLTMLQHFAHSAPGSAARDAKKSLVAREIKSWKESRHYKIAHWHAEGIISSVEKAISASSSKAEQQRSSRSANTEPRRLPCEAPHVPYAIYYATLVIWCGAITDQKTDMLASNTQAFIARGERILSLHKVHIAQLLARVLYEIK